jgi:hypothetical protein
MTASPHELWPWLALAALGLFHGANPAMGWLFAVALGFQRGSRRAVLLSLIPIALGHAAAVAGVVFALLALGLILDHAIFTRAAAVLLIAWALWHAIYGHRQRLYVGMQTGLAGLLLWSFLMASAHGAGLMVIPVVLPICGAAGTIPGAAPGEALGIAVAAAAIHSAVMLATIAAIAVVVYEWVGVGFLRRGWINLDQVWIAALLACGIFLLIP